MKQAAIAEYPECGFFDYCSRNDVKPEYPINLLPNLSSGKAQELAFKGVNDLRNVPDNMLNGRQRRVKEHTLANTVFFDAAGAATDLAAYSLPAYFLDFETIQFAVPIWKGTRPYQQISFQFSLHRLAESGQLEERSFLDLSGNNPSVSLAQALISACGEQGPVFVYNAQFESACIRGLAKCYPHLSESRFAINARLVDLLPITRERYYHPSQQGSWSLKKVLPSLVPELSHDALDGVQDGEMAMAAFLEGIHPSTSAERKNQIEHQLLAYCRLDTYAMVRLWQILSGNSSAAIHRNGM